MKGCLMEIINLGQADGLPPVDWAAVAEKLAAGSAPAPDAANSRTTWLSTLNEDGSPHVTAVGPLWLDGTFWFQTGAGTRKGRNVARDPRCSIAVSIRDADVVIGGGATRVTEPGGVARTPRGGADTGWPADPDDSGSGITAPFNAPSQGPPPWNVYRIEPRSAVVTLSAEPGGLTRFRFCGGRPPGHAPPGGAPASGAPPGTSRSSRPTAATSCTPTGRPSAVQCSGRLTAGWPVMLN